MSGVIITVPKVGEVWTSKADPTIKLTVMEVNGDGTCVWFQQAVPDDAPCNFVDFVDSFRREANPPAVEPDSIEVVETNQTPAPGDDKSVQQLLAEMTPSENEAAERAARTAQTMHEMLRLTRPTVFEAMTSCVALLLEVTESLGVDVDEACRLIKGTHTRLVQHRAEQAGRTIEAAERASEAS